MRCRELARQVCVPDCVSVSVRCRFGVYLESGVEEGLCLCVLLANGCGTGVGWVCGGCEDDIEGSGVCQVIEDTWGKERKDGGLPLVSLSSFRLFCVAQVWKLSI